MTKPRKQLVSLEATLNYRCVRPAFLCRHDKQSDLAATVKPTIKHWSTSHAKRHFCEVLEWMSSLPEELE